MGKQSKSPRPAIESDQEKIRKALLAYAKKRKVPIKAPPDYWGIFKRMSKAADAWHWALSNGCGLCEEEMKEMKGKNYDD